MARGVRKSKREKLEEELFEVRESLEQYNNAIETLKRREAGIISDLEQEAIKEVLQLLTEHDMTAEDLKELINNNVEELKRGA